MIGCRREFIASPGEKGVTSEDLLIPDYPSGSSYFPGDEALEDHRGDTTSHPSIN